MGEIKDQFLVLFLTERHEREVRFIPIVVDLIEYRNLRVQEACAQIVEARGVLRVAALEIFGNRKLRTVDPALSVVL